MKRLALAIAATAVLVGAASGAAAAKAKWLAYPTCTATSTTLTCTGTVTGLRRTDPHIMSLSTEVDYTCPDSSVVGINSFLEGAQAGIRVQNGKPFALSYSPAVTPTFANEDCLSGWIRDPNYYGVVVLIQEQWLGPATIAANLGTISPS
jgi:hypothetical protein